MLIRRHAEIPSSEITPEGLYVNRRQFIAAFGAAAGSSLLTACEARAGTVQDEATPYEDVTTYNNFYEFGTGKEDPSENAPKLLQPRPWTVKIDGLVEKPGDYHLEDVVRGAKLVDRTYRLRCVEAWSMVIPWRGFPLRDLIARVRPTAGAKLL